MSDHKEISMRLLKKLHKLTRKKPVTLNLDGKTFVVSKEDHGLKVRIGGLDLDCYIAYKLDLIIMLRGMDLVGEYYGIRDVKSNGKQISEEAAFKLLEPLSKPRNSKLKTTRRFLFKRWLLSERILHLRAGQRLTRRLPNNKRVTLYFTSKKRKLIVENAAGTRVIFSDLDQRSLGKLNAQYVVQDLAGAFNLEIRNISKQLTKLLNDHPFQCSFRMANGKLVYMNPCETVNKRIADAFVLGVTPNIVPLLKE